MFVWTIYYPAHVLIVTSNCIKDNAIHSHKISITEYDDKIKIKIELEKVFVLLYEKGCSCFELPGKRRYR